MDTSGINFYDFFHSKSFSAYFRDEDIVPRYNIYIYIYIYIHNTYLQSNRQGRFGVSMFESRPTRCNADLRGGRVSERETHRIGMMLYSMECVSDI